MKTRWTCLGLSLVTTMLVAQDANRLKDMTTYLASRELLGRKTGQPGGDKAADWLAEQYRTIGLATVSGGQTGTTPYHHLYTLRSSQAPVDGTMSFGKVDLQAGIHFDGFGAASAAGDSIFLGYGRASEIRTSAVAGRWVVVLEGSEGFQADRGMLDPEATLVAKLRAAKEAGALGLVVLEAEHPSGKGVDYWRKVNPARVFQPEPEDADLVSFPRIMMHPEGGRLMDRPLLERNSLAAQPSLGRFTPAFSTPRAAMASQPSNIVGQIVGTDPTLKDQVIVVTAHYDHLGGSTSSYYPGADDNASGTAGLVELARLLAGSAPKRTIVFAAMSGEEMGLLGSAAFVANPPIPLNRMVANINLDMIGRNGSRTLYITPAAVANQVTTLVSKLRELAKNVDLATNKGIDQYWRQSDHYSFAQKGIPSIFFNTGDHADLHKTTDTADKCDYPKMAKVVSLAKALVQYWANTSEKPQQVASSTYNAWSWPVNGSGTNALAISSHPAAQTVQPGTSVTFQVAATGGTTPYKYQWLKNGSAISGATSASYTFTAQAADDGALFKATVTDSAASPATVTSNEARLIVSSQQTGELIQNGGFENGTSPWAGNTERIGDWSSNSEPAYEGSRAAYLGGVGRTATHKLSQSVTVPASAASASLSFYLHIDTAETENVIYDKLAVDVLDNAGKRLGTLATYSNVNKATGYQKRTFDMSAYKGKAIKLQFTMTEDASLKTSFLVDKVSLMTQ